MSVVPKAGEFRVAEETSSPSPAAQKPFGLLGRVVAWIAHEMRVSRDMRRLAEFDDHMLRDIGIARTDIEGAVRRGHDDSSLIAPAPSLLPTPSETGWP
jgi:uncharacterized protein YjiS (DUF1127 family)